MSQNLSQQIALQFEEVHLNGHWISTNLKTQLSDIDWQMATTKLGSLNSIADLAFHINYYVAGLVQVFEGGSLDIRDKYSFDTPPIRSQADWEQLLHKLWQDAERFTELVNQLPESQLNTPFVDAKYGNYHRNIQGMIQHAYYHLGQIVIIKKLLEEG